jgi:hypothetical protein
MPQVCSCFGRDQRLTFSARESRRFDAAGRDGYGRLALGSIEQAGMIELEVTALVTGQAAREQALDDIERFRQALATLRSAGPTGPDDVLVQAFARAEPERESIVAEQPRGGRALAMIAGW